MRGVKTVALYTACGRWWWWQIGKWTFRVFVCLCVCVCVQRRWVHDEVWASSLSLKGKLKFAFGESTNLSSTPSTFYISHSFWREMPFCKTLKTSDTATGLFVTCMIIFQLYLQKLSYLGYMINNIWNAWRDFIAEKEQIYNQI